MNSGIDAKRINRARILLKGLEFECKEKSCKATQNKMVQPGAQDVRKRGKIWQETKGKTVGRGNR
jgi:hypothetical protein